MLQAGLLLCWWELLGGRSLRLVSLPALTFCSPWAHSLTERVSAVQPVYARQAFPCFDEPRMKATFQLTLLTDPGVPVVLFNMPLLHGSGNIDTSTGLRKWEFGTSPVMSSYLVAFALGKSLRVNLCRLCNRPSQIPNIFSIKQWDGKGDTVSVQVLSSCLVAFAVSESLRLLPEPCAGGVSFSAQ